MALLALAAVGCSTGGGGTPKTPLAVELLSTPRTDGVLIYFRLHRVELLGADRVLAYRNDRGLRVNSEVMNGIEFPLGLAQLGGGDYTAAELTFSREVEMGVNPTVLKKTFVSSLNAPGEKSLVRLNLPDSINAGNARAGLAIRFQFDKWTDGPQGVTPVFSQGAFSGSNSLVGALVSPRKGLVTELQQSPTSADFVLVDDEGGRLRVSARGSVLANMRGATSPVLTANSTVWVMGTMDFDSLVLNALRIIVVDSGTTDLEYMVMNARTKDSINRTINGFSLVGPASSANASDAPISLPSTSRLYFSGGLPIGSDQFFSTVGFDTTLGVFVEPNPVGGRFVAAAAMFLANQPNEANAEVSGPVLQTMADRIVLRAEEWQGFILQANAETTVNFAGTTAYRGVRGDTISQAEFMASARNGSKVSVSGRIADGFVEASICRLLEN